MNAPAVLAPITSADLDRYSSTDLVAAMTGLRFSEVARVIVALRVLASIDPAVETSEFIVEDIPPRKPGLAELVDRQTLRKIAQFAFDNLPSDDYARLRLAKYG